MKSLFYVCTAVLMAICTVSDGQYAKRFENPDLNHRNSFMKSDGNLVSFLLHKITNDTLFCIQTDNAGNKVWETSYALSEGSNFYYAASLAGQGYFLTVVDSNYKTHFLFADTLGVLQKSFHLDSPHFLNILGSVYNENSDELLLYGVSSTGGGYEHVLCMNPNGQINWSYQLPINTALLNTNDRLLKLNNNKLLITNLEGPMHLTNLVYKVFDPATQNFEIHSLTTQDTLISSGTNVWLLDSNRVFSAMIRKQNGINGLWLNITELNQGMQLNRHLNIDMIPAALLIHQDNYLLYGLSNINFSRYLSVCILDSALNVLSCKYLSTPGRYVDSKVHITNSDMLFASSYVHSGQFKYQLLKTDTGFNHSCNVIPFSAQTITMTSTDSFAVYSPSASTINMWPDTVAFNQVPVTFNSTDECPTVGIDETYSSGINVEVSFTNDFILIHPLTGRFNCSIFNSSGQLIHNSDINNPASLDITGFKKGIYILRLDDGKAGRSYKFLKM